MSLAIRVRATLSSSRPANYQRVIFASLIAVLGGLIAWSEYRVRAHSDFGMVWFGTRAMLDGLDPYALIGPGKTFDYDWPLIYPGTALVAVIPFAAFSERLATTAFVAVSSWLLGFGITRDGWYRIPLFATGAFMASARLGQWSIFFCAALFLPWLAFLSAAKPQAAIPVLATSTERRTILAAIAGAVILLIASLVIAPHWPSSWIAAVGRTTDMDPPIIRFGGPLMLLTLLRWRRPETWLLLTLAVTPQSWGWYNTLILFTIPATFGEAVFLAAIALFGGWYADNVLDPGSLDDLLRSVGSVVVLTIYLPSALLILRRKNTGPSPAWLAVIAEFRRKSALASPTIAGR